MTVRERRPVLPRRQAVLLALVPLLAGCSIGVPDPTAAQPPASSAASVATPSVTPGHDADAVAARDLPFGAGDALAPGTPVLLSDGLGQAPGWAAGKKDVAGTSEYRKPDGCLVAARVRVNQWPLAVPGDDRASTEALFHYLDPSILPGYLTVDTLPWGGQPGKPGPRAELLVFGGDKPGSRATASYARLFAKTGSSVFVSVSCPDRAALAAARADVSARLALLPPSS
jgi:hypothetical protein